MLLEGVMKVLEHFDRYLDIPQIKELADQVFGRGGTAEAGVEESYHPATLVPATLFVESTSEQCYVGFDFVSTRLKL